MQATSTTVVTPPSSAAASVRRLLVPTDFSASADRAFAYAVALAAPHHASVCLLHVLTYFDPAYYGIGFGAPKFETQSDRVQEEAQEELGLRLRTYIAPDVEVTPVVRNSLAIAPTILHEAEAYGADLIVMGTHGRRGMRHLLLGSVAEEVVQHADVPVLTVPADASLPTDGPVRIVAPTDFSATADIGVEAAAAWTARLKGTLDLVHAIEPVPFPASIATGRRSLYELLPELRGQLQDELKAQAAALPVAASAVLESGPAAATIARVAEERGASLIVVAVQRVAGLAHVLHGRTALRLVQLAPCPVLTIPVAAVPRATALAARAPGMQLPTL